MSSEPEQLLEDIIVELDGYYPHQLAQKIIEALDRAGFHITRKLGAR